ncbi:interleukin-12 receptor subunit beta-2 [Pleuronectes platessa]|uniref:interleukin-12 receptor subunit beta-2 n=1 Tax=Pleuronectes platessa TaxID=8262 RepID=UPI00232A108D|nr:interleukin-12 receptor subunit beta-2 [Pleuronectes platessa]
MSQTCSVLIAAALLVVQLCMGEKSCTIWSSAGAVVQRDTSFDVYCTFNCKCRGSMYSGHPSTPQNYTELNSTTIYFKVVNITKNRTYSCQCSCSTTLDPCGLDIFTGYVPDSPKNLSCIYKVLNNKSGDVLCTWNRGRQTFLRDKTQLWLSTLAGNHTSKPEPHNVSSKGTGPLSVTFTVLRSVQLISVCVKACNELGPVVNATVEYSLTDIAMPLPPVLGRPECSSRECVFTVEQPVRTQNLQIQYKAAEQKWTSHPDLSVPMSSVPAQSISSLEPYSLYHFKVRSRFSTGLWSQWSTNISSWTQEEAPAKELDVWYAESECGSKSPRVYWKKPQISIARGKILGYRVRVYCPGSGLDRVTNISQDDRNYSVPTCANGEVTVWARNSKGLSPPATITHHTKAKSSQDVQVTTGIHNVTISWREPETALLPASYVVEWYPEGQKLEELRWVRLGGSEGHAVITGIKPFECYRGAVYVFYSDSSVTRMVFSGVTTLESAPEVGPSFQETFEGQIVKVTWTELPRSKQRGCITNYTIYLENSSGHLQRYSVPASVRTYVIQPLSPAVYSLWMTASTAEGEGPMGQQMKFLIQQGTLLTNVLVFGAIALIVVIVCLCHFSAVNQKFWVFCQCLMLDVVPDPANSKWAKECTHEKGKMNLQQQHSNSSTTEEEEEPILVDIEELPRQSGNISTSQLPPQISQSLDATPPYPATTYIKSLSHDSDSSDHTQSTTVDYISSHCLGDMEEDQEEEDQEEEEERLGFSPSHHLFSGPMSFGGKLTLDAVKIDFCSDFFQDG